MVSFSGYFEAVQSTAPSLNTRRQLDQAVNWMANNSQSQLLLELPPLYVYAGNPGAEAPGQDIRNPASAEGYRAGFELRSSLMGFAGERIRTYHLIDELNGRPEPFTNEAQAALNDCIQAISGTTSPLDRIQYESDFVREGQHNNCAHLDSRFQFGKMNSLLAAFQGDITEMLLNGRLLILHPESFVISKSGTSQQEAMLGNLLGQMKSNENWQRLPKPERQKAVSQCFRWLTFEDNGNCSGYAAASWNGQAFSISPQANF